MTVVHSLVPGLGEYPSESEYILCDLAEIYLDPKCSTDDKYVTCKRCLKMLAKQSKGRETFLGRSLHGKK